MKGFDFATAGRILFGAGTLARVAPLAAEMGRCALLVTGSDPDRAAALGAQLEGAGMDVLLFAVAGEPTVGTVLDGVEWAREGQCELVIGFGGGSVLDAAKGIAALLANPGDPLDFLEVVGRGQPLRHPAAPCIAIPTTAGTGSEVTRNAVLVVPERRVKVSLRDPSMLPRLAVVDPTLTHSLPPSLTASTGLDALTQLIEPFVSPHATPLTDLFCREGIPLAFRALPRAVADGSDAVAREEMAYASLLGGLALANARLGGVHGFAGPLGGMLHAPHGAVCAALLPHVMAANVAALRARAAESEALRRYEELGRMLGGAGAEAGVARIAALVASLGVPPLGSYGLGPDDFPELIEKAAGSSSMKGNPIPLTEEEMGSILQAAW